MSHRLILLLVSCTSWLSFAPSLAESFFLERYACCTLPRTPIDSSTGAAVAARSSSSLIDTTVNGLRSRSSEISQNPAELFSQSADPYEEAKRLAKEAVAAGKTAYTTQQWADIAQKWKQASDFMATVASDDDRYEMAQERVGLYRQNSQIALEEVDKSRLRSVFPSFQSTLRLGNTGMLVSQLQYRLKTLGYFEGTIDGSFRESTATAVSAFQNAQGLEDDGIVGLTTWQRLQEARAASASPTPPPTPQQTEDAQSSTRGNVVRRALIGLAGLAAVVGMVLLLLKLLSRSRQELPNQELEFSEIDDSSGAVVADGEGLDPALSSPLDVEAKNNGNLSLLSASEIEKSDEPVPAASESLVVGERLHLAKIDIVDELIEELQSSDLQKRRRAIWELGQRGTSQAAQPLVNLLIDSDSQQRSLILAALSEIGVRTLKPINRALALSLQDGNPEVRKNAIRDLTRVYESIAQVNRLVRYAAEDPDEEVRQIAKWALHQLSRICTAANFDNAPTFPEPETSSDRSSED